MSAFSIGINLKLLDQSLAVVLDLLVISRADKLRDFLPVFAVLVDGAEELVLLYLIPGPIVLSGLLVGHFDLAFAGQGRVLAFL